MSFTQTTLRFEVCLIRNFFFTFKLVVLQILEWTDFNGLLFKLSAHCLESSRSFQLVRNTVLRQKKNTCKVVTSSTDYNPVVSLQFQCWISKFLSVKL